jgi:cytochrome P450
MQMQTLFHHLVTQYPSLKLDAAKPSERDHYSLSFSGFKKLNVIF